MWAGFTLAAVDAPLRRGSTIIDAVDGPDLHRQRERMFDRDAYYRQPGL